MSDYRNVSAVVRNGYGGPSLQKTIRDALQAAGYEIVWSSTSAACDACEGRGYHDAGPVYRGSTCVRQSVECEPCSGTGRAPARAFP